MNSEGRRRRCADSSESGIDTVKWIVSLCANSCAGGGGALNDLGRDNGLRADRGRMERDDLGVWTLLMGGGFGDRAEEYC